MGATETHIDLFNTMLLVILWILNCSISYGLLVLLDGMSIAIMKLELNEGGRTPKVRNELANILLFIVSNCLIQIMKSHTVRNALVLLTEIVPSKFVFKLSLLFRGLYRGDRLLPSKTQLQLLPRAKVSGKVRGV
jgi:hypothetical protein